MHAVYIYTQIYISVWRQNCLQLTNGSPNLTRATWNKSFASS